MTKRTNVLATDASAALADESNFTNNLARGLQYRDNFQTVVIDKDQEEITQLETSLADLDDLIMTQYQLVAAAAGVPATKLIGTSPKGFNATGEYEEASYHEELQSIQECDLDPLLERHYLLLMRSEFPEIKAVPVVVWNALDAQTAEETALTNKAKAETDKILFDAGAIDGEDIRARLIADPKSGYSGIEEYAPEPIDGEEVTDPQAG
jgi:phage-related protein (TIGR01555 family)